MRSSVVRFAGPVAIFLLAILICAPRLGNPAEFDELYHVLAARGWVETGRFAIAEGEYTRASQLTLLIGVLFQVLGDSILVARLPSAAAYASLATLFFVWMRRQTQPAAAWTASLLLLSSPFMVELGGFVRFYMLQILLFFVAVVLLHKAFRINNIRKTSVYITIASLTLLLNVYIQISTLVGILGIFVWLTIEYIPSLYLKLSSRSKIIWIASTSLAGMFSLLLASELGILQIAFHVFRSTPQFQQDTINQFWFYHFWLVLYYPTLWTLFPIIFLLSLAAYPRTAKLCGSIFLTAFIVHSFGGRKDTRYIAYAFPFLFALLGMGVAIAWPKLRRLIAGVLWQVLPAPGSGTVRSRLEAAVLGLFLAFVVLANGAAPRLVTMLAGIRVPPQPPLADWRAAAGELAPWLGRVDVVLTTDELAALYHLGDYDVLVSPSRLSEVTPRGQDFVRDERTGRPVIASPEALRSVLNCFRSGLLVSDRTRLEDSSRRDIAELLVREARSLPLPRAWSIDAYVWEGRQPSLEPAFCQDIVRRLGRQG